MSLVSSRKRVEPSVELNSAGSCSHNHRWQSIVIDVHSTSLVRDQCKYTDRSNADVKMHIVYMRYLLNQIMEL